MGVKRPWLTWVLLAGLVAVFAGARIFDGTAALRIGLIVAGGLAVGAAMALRAIYWRQAEGNAKAMETVFGLGYAGCALALVGFVPATDFGLGLLGLEFEELRSERRFKHFFLVTSSILVVCSVLPVAAAQWAVGKGGRSVALHVDSLRVGQTAAGALSAALAAVSLLFIGYIASEFNRSADFSYFKTASPGKAAREIVLNMDEPLTAALFFPEVNPVKDELLLYLNELARMTGKVAVEEYDRFTDPVAAEEFGSRGDGSLFLRKGNATELLHLGLDFGEAEGTLRVLDSHMQEALLKLSRERRVVYLTTGHSELNDPLAAQELGGGPRPDPGQFDTGLPPLQMLREMLGFLNYDVYDIGIDDGLGDRIPDDAAILMILGPRRPFLDAETEAVRDYLDRGGSLLLALESGTEFRLDGLDDKLGVEYDPDMTINDLVHYNPPPRTLANRRQLVTNRFSAHPSVTTPSREGRGIRMVGSGSFTPGEDVPGLKTESIIESPPGSYPDRNGNFSFDEDSEERSIYHLAIAVERADSTIAAEDEARGGMRALVYGDAEIFSDLILSSHTPNTLLALDAVRWLGGEEEFVGEVVSEEDIPVFHTRSENVIWFYSIIFGAPAVVLGLGLAMVYAQRNRRRQARSL